MNAIQSKFASLLDNPERNYKMAQKGGRAAYSLFRFALLFGVGFIILYPMLFMISVAIRPSEQMLDAAVIWIPRSLTFQNIVDAYNGLEYGPTFLHTTAITLMSTVLQCISCSLVGYGFAKFKFRGKGILFALVLFTLVVPPQTVNLPLFINYNYFDFFGIGQIPTLFGADPWRVSLLNTYWPNFIASLTASGLRAGLFIYMFRSFYSSLPAELEDAAYIDGAGFFTTYLRVMWPNAGAMTLVTFMLSFVWYWNDYVRSALILNEFNLISIKYDRFTNALASSMSFNSGVVQVQVQAAGMLWILPILIMYIILQRRFTESVVKSGIVG